MKKVLVIGAGFLQSFLIKKAKELGYYTLAVDKDAKAIGFKDAHAYEVVDIVDQMAVLEYARSQKIDGVLTASTDYGVLTAAYVATELGLPGLDLDTARLIKNKYQVRRKLWKDQMNDVSQFFEVNDVEEIETRLRHQIQYPVIVKPCDGSGSRAVQKVDSETELKHACQDAIHTSSIGVAFVEEFVVGTEYGVEAIVIDYEIHILGVLGKFMTLPPDYAELGHFIPIQFQIEEKVKRVATTAIKGLGIQFGAVNMDVIVTQDERVVIVDVGARMGGNLIGSHLIPMSTCFDYMGGLVRLAVGDPVNVELKPPEHYVVTQLLALKPGEVEELPDFEAISQACQVTLYHHLSIGSVIGDYHNNLDGWGYVVSVATDYLQAKQQAERAKDLIDQCILRKKVERLKV